MPFTAAELQVAMETWGCNCGPAALAFATGLCLGDVRYHIPLFEERGYTSPTMMTQALLSLGWTINTRPKPQPDDMFARDEMRLVRIQWDGKWTEPTRGKWSGRHTHWIACWIDGAKHLVYDVNSEIVAFDFWNISVAPRLMAQHEGCTGWSVANAWGISK